MRVAYLKVLAVLSLWALGLGIGKAAEGQTGSTPVSNKLGLNVSVTPQGYSFRRPDQTGPANAKPIPSSFLASVAVTNLSRKDLTFSFIEPTQADLQKFSARVFDSFGDLVWASNPTPSGNPASPALVHAVLKSGKRWAGSVVIPLVINGRILSPGTYSLEVTLGTSDVGASTQFEVTGTEPPDTRPGIDGTVSFSERFTTAGPEGGAGGVSRTDKSKPLAGAEITITTWYSPQALASTVQNQNVPSSPVTVWTGRSGSDGKFRAALPPGKYIVVATKPANLLISSTASTVSQSVSVPLQGRASASLTFVADYWNDVLQQTSLFGTVLALGNGGTKLPARSATAVIDQLASQVAGTALLFHWKGTTNNEGRFEVNPPPGNYRVTVTLPSIDSPMPGRSKTLETYVADGVPTQADFLIDNTTRAAQTQ